MSDFKAIMHQIHFRLGLPLGQLTALPQIPWERGEGRGKRGGKGRGRRRREGRGGLSGNVAEEAFCLKSAPAYGRRFPSRVSIIIQRLS